MDNRGVDRVDEIRLAGTFGSRPDAKYAVTVGMIPDCDLDQVSAAGHAARTGEWWPYSAAPRAGKSSRSYEKCTKSHWPPEPAFQEHFVEAMGIPATSVTSRCGHRRRSTRAR